MTDAESASLARPSTGADKSRERRLRVSTLFLGLLAAGALVALLGAGSVGAVAQATSSITIDARDFACVRDAKPPLGNQCKLEHFNYVINVDNTKLPDDPLALNTESNSAIVKEGNETTGAIALPSDGCDATHNAGPGGTGCRYLISIRSPNHKMWGKHITLPQDAGTVRIDMTEVSADHPQPLGKIRVFVFQDNSWTNGAPDTEEAGLGKFQVGLEEQTGSAVTVDYNNKPLCGGTCETSNDAATRGFVEIPNLGPASYFIDVHPPDGPCNSDPHSHWYQTTTIDGGLNLMAPTEEGADGTGAPGEQLWEPPNIRTAYWFGFVCAPQPFASPGTGEIVGQARNWTEWAPYTTGTFDDPVEEPFVALSDANTDQTVYVGRGDAGGNFDIQNVPAGDYNLAIWDEQLSYIMRFKPITVASGQTVDANDVGDNGEPGVGVSRWFGWLDGHVYKDLNNNGKYDPGTDAAIGNTDVDQRWRDGSIKESTVTDPGGYYQYPTAEGGALGRWFINEQGFTRFSAYPGPSVHDERTGDVTPSCGIAPPATPAPNCMPTSQGGGLLHNQLLLEGHRATVDWGKRDYPAGTPGQIVGITYFATTRNEFDARFQAHEDYEPAIPDATVYLETLGPDGQPNTDDDVIVNKYVTDHWQQPNESQGAQDNGQGGTTLFTQSCNPLRGFNGADVTDQFSPKIGPNCLEVPLTGQQSKDGAFDGGYAFAEYCPNGYDMTADDGTCTGGSDPVPLVAGTYITHAVMPKDAGDTRDCNPTSTDGFKSVTDAHGAIPGGGQGCLFRSVSEDDVNVDLGNQFTGQIPPPPCTGDMHVIDQSTLTPRSTFYTGDQATSPSQPLCDKRLVVLQNGQNANADFHMMTNFNTDPNGENPSDTRAGDVAEPGRVVGQVFNDIYFERNQKSPWYGEPRPIPNIPIGIYSRVDTVPNVNQPFTKDKWRLVKTLTTSADGSYEALLPSTETFNCPIPQGPCPGMYIAIVNDPGTTDNRNTNYNPNLLTANTPFEIWPGLTDQLDTPVDPISGTGCELPAGAPGGTAPDPSDPAVPELLQVSRAAVGGTTPAGRTITIQGDFIGVPGTGANATRGRLTLTDVRTGAVTTLTQGGGGITAWTSGTGSTADSITFTVPSVSTNFTPGPKELTIITANSNPGGGNVPSVNGLTIHVLGTGTGGAPAYNPGVVNVPAPGADPHALQSAIDGAAAGSLILLSPGTYNENILLWKPVKLQGLGPGGIIGAHEFQGRDPEDPRFNIPGTVIDGRFFQQNFTAFDKTVTDHAPYVLPNFTSGSPSVVLRGADLTVVAKNPTDYNVGTVTGDSAGFGGARIDGLGLMTGHGDGAGGIQLQAAVNNMQLTNNVVENNGGIFAGGIGIGQPFVHASHNYNVRVANDRLIGNGGLTSSGGLGIFYGSNNYEVTRSIMCSNFGVEYGAGISHIGLSPGGSIHDNKIYYNDAVDSGAGIAIESELPAGGGLGDGSGTVNVDRNLIQSNFSGDDGGGIFVLNALDQPLNIRNNMIVDNGAADMGGAMVLDDSSKVNIVNNTVSANVTTGSSENSQVGKPHAAGLATEANESAWQTDPRYAAQYPNASTRPDFSNPTALFNNIFWNNDAQTLDQFGPGAALVDQGFIDFEIRGTTNNSDTFTPRYSTLTNGNLLGPNGQQNPVPSAQANRIGEDPLFVTPFTLELTVSGSRLDPQQAAVTITGADPPVGLTGDYHLQTTSPAIDRGAGFSNLPAAAPANQTPNSSSILAPCSGTGAQQYAADFDRQLRPQVRVNARARTPWDLGADELPGTVLTIPRNAPGSLGVTFNWNGGVGSGQLQCSASTETR